MAPCGCLQGLFGGRPNKSLAPDMAARRFTPAGPQLSVDEVISMVRARPTPAVTMKGAAQSWASPIPAAQIRAPTTTENHGKRDLDKRSVSRLQVEQLGFTPSSLPPPMPAHERERVIRNLLPTATHKMLSKLPKELVEACSMEGQTLRRRLLDGATVVFFTAGYPGKRFVFERAAQLGIKTVVIEHPDSWAKGLVDEGIIAKFIPVDMGRPAEEVLAESLAQIKGLGADGLTGEADAILTVVELSVPLVAALCEQLGLPGPPPAAVNQARDKHATRAAMKAAGLPTPKNFLIESEDMVSKAAEHVGFPAVLKPVSGAASLGVRKVVHRGEMMACYKEVVAELQGLVVVSGALVQDTGTGQGVAANKVMSIGILMEQYLDGQEVDIDIVMSGGQWRYAAITDNGPTIEPYFNETWGNCPSLLPLEQQRELKEFGVAATEALGFTDGVFHVECKYTSTGPQLIEVNGRMGGGPVHEHNIRVWGVDLVEESIFVAMGIPCRPCVPRDPLEPIAYYLKTAETSGIVGEMPDLAEISRRPGVIWAKPMVKVGDNMTGPADGLPTWLVDIMVKGRTPQECVDFAFQLEREAVVKHQ